MLPRLVPAVLLLLGSGSLALVAEQSSEQEMRTFQLVFVVQNPEFEDEEWLADRMKDHRADRTKTAGNLYLRNLVKDKVALVAGPLPDNDRIQQVAVLDLDNAKDAAFVFQHSPAIETGRLQLEIYSWWAPDGILKTPKDPDATRDFFLGMLKRPANAPDYPVEKLEELQRGHLENLQKMTESTDLVIAGSVDSGGDLLGIAIFRGRDPKHIEELMARDPALQAGRLKLELHRWHVPKGSWPRKADLLRER